MHGRSNGEESPHYHLLGQAHSILYSKERTGDKQITDVLVAFKVSYDDSTTLPGRL